MAPLEKTATSGTTGTSPSQRFERKQKLNFRVLFTIGFVTIGSAAYGYAGAIIATTLTQPSFVAHMGLDTAPNASALIGAINALYYAGGAFGSFISGWMCNAYGRKITVIVGNVLTAISGALLTASVNPAMFIVFRFFSGLGSFMILASVPIWVAELAPPNIRGILIDVHCVLMMTGYTLACYVGVGFYFVEGPQAWRGPMALSVALPLVLLSGIYWMPESPRYLLSKGKVDEARDITFKLHSNPDDPHNEFATREFYQMHKQLEIDKKLAVSYLGLLKIPSMRKRVMMTVLLQFSLMSSGILVILNYGSIIWESLGFTTVQIINFQGGFQVTGLVFNVVAMAFVDRVSRPLLIGGGMIITAAMMAVELTLQRFYVGSDSKPGLIACVVFIFLFQITYSLFLDGPTYFYTPEIWPSHVRSQGSAIAMATLSLTSLMWLQIAPVAFEEIGWRYYLCFVLVPTAGGIIILFTFKDTLHKPLEEVAALFGDHDIVAVYQGDLNLENVLHEKENDIEEIREEHASAAV